jgi:hypothetical protein
MARAVKESVISAARDASDWEASTQVTLRFYAPSEAK